MLEKMSVRKLNRSCTPILLVIAIVFAILVWGPIMEVNADTSGDAYITYDPITKTWTMGTAAIEKKVKLDVNGQFLLTSFKNKLTNREYIQGTQNSDEFQVTLGTTTYNGSTTGWVYDIYSISTLSDTSLQLCVTFHNNVVKVTRYYNVFPNTGVIKEWSVFQNISGSSQNFSSPYIFKQRIMQNDISNVDFNYMTGGGNFTGSWIYKTVAMTTSYARTFNSLDTPEIQTVDGQNGGYVGNPYNGTAVYDEFFVFSNRATNEGVWLAFDYNGHWYANIGNYGTSINLSGYVSMTDYAVANNSSISGPKSTIGVFAGDTDDMGNTINDYIYSYQWDYTNDDYIGPGTWQWRRNPQNPNVFESINFNRYVGGKLVHIDDNWYDKKGNWNVGSPATDNIETFVSYADKSEMKIKLWMPPWQADMGSEVLNSHPEYICQGSSLTFYGYPLDISNTSVKNWILSMLNSKQAEFGTYMLRVDGLPAYPVNGSNNNMLMQSQNFFDIFKIFKDNNPDAGLDGCASGGETAMMEAMRFADNMQLSDGNAMHYAGYYTCLNKPIGKIQAAFSAGLSGEDTCFNNLVEKSTDAMEIVRKNFERRKYLKSQGLSGRWVKVFRPTLSEGKDKTYLLQLMNSTNDKAYFTLSNFFPYYNQSFIIYPKGLKPTTNYTVRSTTGSVTTTTQTGTYWMTNGINVANLQQGELISMNLPHVPGEGFDTMAPTVPTNISKITSVYDGHFGIELNWTAGTDNILLSYYEIFRNGVAVNKVSTGTFDFVTDGNISDIWEIRSVDGDGNVSSKVTASMGTGSVPTPSPAPALPSKYIASNGFSSTQGINNWIYLQETPVDYYMNMSYDIESDTYIGNEQFAIVGPDWQHPGVGYNSVRQWFAPKDCRVLVTGTAKMEQLGGDGVIAKIKMNDSSTALSFTNIWEASIAGTDTTTGQSHSILADMKQNDSLFFSINKNGTNYFDTTNWNPTIYIGGTPHTALSEFSSTQSTNSWYYQEWDGNAYANMAWDSASSYWRGSEEYVLVMSDSQHPGNRVDSARVWQSSVNATIEIKGNVKMSQAGGDGVNLTIYKNNQALWDSAVSGNDTSTGVNFDFLTGVAPGDKIYFRVNKNGNNYFDSTILNPTIIIYN